MSKSSRYPVSTEAVAIATAGLVSHVQDAEPPLTPADVAFLCGLDPHVSGDARVRADMLALMTSQETVDAITKYAPVLSATGVYVSHSAETVAQLQKLQRLQRRLELAQSVVQRHIQRVGAPMMETASDLHRVVVATPESSPMRVAFSLFLAQWADTFRAYSRKAKGDAGVKDNNSDTTPRPT